MVIEKLIRYAGLAVGLKPSATECEARLRGLERSMYSKNITASYGRASSTRGMSVGAWSPSRSTLKVTVSPTRWSRSSKPIN